MPTRKNLSQTYVKKTSVQNIVDDVQSKEVTATVVERRPVSAGGRSDIPATLSQEHLQFVDGTDEIPEWLLPIAWGVITRMNCLTNIDGDFDFERVNCGVRAMLRPLQWARKITLQDMSQIEYYVGIQLRKAKGGRERTLIAPGYSNIVHQEVNSNMTAIDERQAGFAAQGMVQKNVGGRRQDRRG